MVESDIIKREFIQFVLHARRPSLAFDDPEKDLGDDDVSTDPSNPSNPGYLKQVKINLMDRQLVSSSIPLSRYLDR